MRKLLLFFSLALFFLGCNKSEPDVRLELVADKVQDGYVSDWTVINAIEPPPPAPFKFQGGSPIDFSWVTTPQIGRAAEVEVDFFIAMGAVGRVKFAHTGSALGVATSTAKIEKALNSWTFSNNGSGEIKLRINFGKKEAKINVSKMQLLNGVDFHQQSFHSALRGGKLK